jgi:hypothetical protein
MDDLVYGCVLKFQRNTLSLSSGPKRVFLAEWMVYIKMLGSDTEYQLYSYHSHNRKSYTDNIWYFFIANSLQRLTPV